MSDDFDTTLRRAIKESMADGISLSRRLALSLAKSESIEKMSGPDALRFLAKWLEELNEP